MLVSHKTEQLNGLSLHKIETKKYKTNTIVLKLKAPLTEEHVTLRALLPHVLQNGTKTYPSSTAIRKYLDDLYGATLNVDASKKGEYQIISFSIEIANERFLKDKEPLLEKAIQLLGDILLQPRLENNTFPSEVVEKEKRTLKQRIESVFDDKMRYANMRLIEEMCSNEPYRLHAHGKKEDVQSITPEKLYNYYQKSLKDDEVHLYVVGDISDLSVEKFVQNSFHFTNAERTPVQANTASKKVTEEHVVFENQDIKQGKLHIGYRTNTTFGDNDYFALQVFNGIFGGFSHSKLFINVREKASLAYYAASRVESHKGLLMVMSGIEFENYDSCVNIIKEQMALMKKGEFSDEELSQTKAVIKNQVLETIDTSYGLIEILYHNEFSHVKRNVEEWLSNVDSVSRQEVIDVANKITLDTIYFLKGLEREE